MAKHIVKKTILPGNRIRALIVDDSVVIRRLVNQALSEDPSIEIVGSVSNGALALARMAQFNPDVITLDIEMPEMDGLEMLRRMDKIARPRVVMFSTLTERGAVATLDALALGADDYVAKAANGGSLDRSLTSLREELIPKIKQFFTLPQQAPKPAPPGVVPVRAAVPAPARIPGIGIAKVMVIGVSTGGPTALGEIIPQLPRDFALPVLIVQHMPPLFTRLLAERLQTSTPLKVEEAAEGSTVTPGRILIAPGDYHMRLRKSGSSVQVCLDQSPPENSCRPAVDVLFRSASEVYGPNVIGAVLTGMGQDGLRGVEVLKANGAYVIAQDEASSVVWGMPGSVASAGLADSVLPLQDIIPAVLRRIENGK